MTHLIKFDARPDYLFSDDQIGNTVLIWPDKAVICAGTEFEETVDCLHTREKAASGEYFEFAIYDWPMPEDAAAYEEMIRSIAEDDPNAIEPWADEEA